ncbi:MAG: helix-turn-helix domain-containing protein [bacterium]|nr:helix-turn-helix domain-containing protein [bacterium]
MNTKENILLTALRLFARDGFEAVSVSQIAGELGMVKSALYKHYKNKRDIFDSITERMDEMDSERAKAYEMPEGDMEKIVDAYKTLPLDQIRLYSKAQFQHWTQEEFPSLFRKMLTLEQFRSKEMSELYQKHLTSSPVTYMKEIFMGMVGDEAQAEQLALEFYGPIFLLYSLYDVAENKETVTALLDTHVERFSENLRALEDCTISQRGDKA